MCVRELAKPRLRHGRRQQDWATVAAGSQRRRDGSLHKIVGSGMSYGCPCGGFIGSAKPTLAARTEDRAGRWWPTGGSRMKEGGAVWLGLEF